MTHQAERSTILLTGCAGFIGTHLTQMLLDRGFFVIGVDYVGVGSSLENLARATRGHAADHFTLIPHDMSSVDVEDAVGDYRHPIDHVINCGAESHVDRSWNQPKKFVDSNVYGPLALARLFTTPSRLSSLKSFVQVSTDEVFDKNHQPYTEETPHNPQNVYSSTKEAAELLLQNYYEAHNLPLIITNGANTFGPNQYSEKIIPKTVRTILKGGKVPLFKSPARRMWLHVKDHASGIIAAMTHGVPGERYCLAPEYSAELYTRELVEKIITHMGKDPKDCIEEVTDRVNYDLRYLMNNSFAKHQLDWKPVHSFDEELPKTVDFFVDQFSECSS